MSSPNASTGSNAGASLGNMVKDGAKVVGGLGDAIRGNINSFADSAVDSTPKAQHNAEYGHTASGVERRTEEGDKVAARGADAMRDGLAGLKGHGHGNTTTY
ncbi:hypothetical protein NCC49_006095 [Naganishia albida]|nr:hypothetical protein NCC49_006095 [Naganishia albida]